jgi:hypothetical protein
LADGVMEFRDRRTDESKDLPVIDAASLIRKLVQG